ncbi:NAD-dependent epimerase/dehydratase family protein [Flavobacterium frigidarium]|uniref:NAD-dependent epimerase/dehydratase family protein n=1 Tax=Flavobacterium frigidarium TaxID=99286 RepID=UPI0030D8BBE6|tara:strand:+ start:1806 stop:2702 length:897 start_codon:yes stop_codon:yes gene_type:complete
MRKVIITGASGFVGVNLTDYLKVDYKILALSARYISMQRFDLGAEIIIHLSGKAHDLKKVSKPQDYYDANFELTKQLFDAFLESKAKVFIFMSTVKAVADNIEGRMTEEITADPKTHYGISKRQAEEYILSKSLPIDKRVFILRPCMIHGIGNKGNLNLLYQLVAKGLPWPLGGFTNKRSFLSIENLCFIIKELLENSKIPSGIYNISDDVSLSPNELIKIIAISLNKKELVWNVNPSLIKSFAKLGDFLYLPLNSERLQKLTENYVVSNDKLIEAIGKPLPIESKEGLLKTFKSFKK